MKFRETVELKSICIHGDIGEIPDRMQGTGNFSRSSDGYIDKNTQNN